MDLYVGVFDDLAGDHQILFTSRMSGLTFGTRLEGGFADMTTTLPLADLPVDPKYLYRRVFAKPVLVGDRYGRLVWSGRIDGAEIGGKGLLLQGVGPYASFKDRTAFLVYTKDMHITGGEIIRDAVDLASDYISPETGLLASPTDDLGEQIFAPEAKLTDVIQRVLPFGLGNSPAYFSIYGNNLPMYYTGAAPTFGSLGWHTFSSSFTTKVGTAASVSSVYNKIQVLWDDHGPHFTDWFEDKFSQSLFGIKEGSISIGSALQGIAETVAALALKAFAYPAESVKIEVTGPLYSFSGVREPHYMVRAGTYLSVDDVPTGRIADPYQTSDVLQLFITSTSYSADNGQLSLEVGPDKLSYEAYLMRMGISGGNVQ